MRLGDQGDGRHGGSSDAVLDLEVVCRYEWPETGAGDVVGERECPEGGIGGA